MIYASVQNGVILDFHETEAQARDRVNEEIKKDWFQIIVQKSIRKLLKKSGGFALHRYHIFKIEEAEEIK